MVLCYISTIVKLEPVDCDRPLLREVRKLFHAYRRAEVGRAGNERRPLACEIVAQAKQQRELRLVLEQIIQRGLYAAGNDTLPGGVANVQQNVGDGREVERRI